MRYVNCVSVNFRLRTRLCTVTGSAKFTLVSCRQKPDCVDSEVPL